MASSAPSMDNGWLASKCALNPILCPFVDECLLQPQETIKWHSALGHGRPFEEINETVMFPSFVERGFAIPTSNFFHGLLFHWGIQAHHLTPNSILHISIFIHLCEAFLGIESHFDLFKYFFPSEASTRQEEYSSCKRGWSSVMARQEKILYPI